MTSELDILLSICIGLGLAAACGFRIFVPLLVMGLAERTGHMTFADGFEWMGSNIALTIFGVATLLEILAYYIPFVDNLLDAAATPSAVVAGMIATGSQVGELDPLMAWSVSVIGGGGAAGVVQGATAIMRQISSLATAGFANPLLSTAEAGAALVMTILAVVVPFAAVALLLLLLFWVATRLLARRARAETA
ncbi:MAG: DUF4126 domain-containing protein [Acidobacteriota bacterium]